ncbi:hypothetical protein [Mycobacterium sp. Aquia_213]|uniref:hypothetical protein n=1 Tax=Mycobacterium sp. Aquia_213 TaxID=2991728 RepID=UPI0022715F0E|nr:hypothetical protein [Mycobacterium sp. Aquia_213]WAC90694.1 hypothetical protein LMQ14_22770 [Mycobacterium sp. Aquia_213]
MTPQVLAKELSTLRLDCGKPSFREMARLAKRAERSVLPKSTAADVLNKGRIPSLETVIEFVLVCAEAAADNGIEIDKARTDQEMWRRLWLSAQTTHTADARGERHKAENLGSLQDAREALISRQRAELESELNVYRSLVGGFSRDALLRALRHAARNEITSPVGVRTPVWETALHFRFVVDSPDHELEVRLEFDSAAVISKHPWDQDMSIDDFLQSLVDAVRSAGADLGTGLNDPTQSIEDLSEMLIEVTKLRSQELRGYRGLLVHIIERVDGWYFTDFAVYPVHNLGYQITVDRLDELDWEDHLEGKGWRDSRALLGFARRLYGQGAPENENTAHLADQWKNVCIAPAAVAPAPQP